MSASRGELRVAQGCVEDAATHVAVGGVLEYLRGEFLPQQLHDALGDVDPTIYREREREG